MTRKLKNITCSEKSFTEASASVRLVLAMALDWSQVGIQEGWTLKGFRGYGGMPPPPPRQQLEIWSLNSDL